MENRQSSATGGASPDLGPSTGQNSQPVTAHHSPTWRQWLTVATEIAGIVAAICAVIALALVLR